MRLLNTTSIEVERFIGDVPSYAILSHRWEEEEVTLEDINATGNGRGMKGYRKLRLSCAMAARQDLKYIWIDTCCIDKTSSAELSEAINSMFRYYQEAEVCYTYLSDVASAKITTPISHLNRKSQGYDFYQSAWFTRGWTLQELIAPKNLRFYNKEWDFLGTKADLKDAIRNITKIPEKILLGGDLTNEPVSRKMSWVSSRQTTVPEDIAYCLLGLFRVNIPLLYGEGKENAFLRLQEAILKSSDDDSIFLWRATEEEAINEPFWGLLAKSPMYFSRSPDIPAPCTMTMTTNTPATLTGRGLNVEFLMALVQIDISASIFSAVILADRGKRAYGVLLQKLSYSGTHFARVGADILLEISREMKIDYFKLPHRVSSCWDPWSSTFLDNPITIIPPNGRPLSEPQALRFYVRQNPKISPVVPNEAVGYFFDARKSLPPNITVDDWSSCWDRWESGGFTPSGSGYILEFETYPYQHITYQDRNVWICKLFGALQLSEQLDGHLERLILLVGLEHTSLNTFNTPLVYHRPTYLLRRISGSTTNPDQFLKNFSLGEHDTRNITAFSYYVSFDLQLLNGQVYYLVKVEKKAEMDVLAAESTHAEIGKR